MFTMAGADHCCNSTKFGTNRGLVEILLYWVGPQLRMLSCVHVEYGGKGCSHCCFALVPFDAGMQRLYQ